MSVLQVSPYTYDDNNSLKAQLHICIDWADWHCTTLLIYVSVIPSTEQCKSTGWKVRNIGQQVVFCLNHICKDLPCYWKDLSVTWLCAVNGIKNPIASRRLSSPPWRNRQMWTKPPASPFCFSSHCYPFLIERWNVRHSLWCSSKATLLKKTFLILPIFPDPPLLNMDSMAFYFLGAIFQRSSCVTKGS